jgi:hypothetical protein
MGIESLVVNGVAEIIPGTSFYSTGRAESTNATGNMQARSGSSGLLLYPKRG